MINNGNDFNKVLFNNQCHCNSSFIRYMSPCEILTEYLHDPYSIFRGKIVQTTVSNPNPQAPPGSPTSSIVPTSPMPPPPLAPITGSAEFISLPGITIAPGEYYPFEALAIRGNAIMHVDGATDIILAPNTVYEYFWRIESRANINVFIVVGAVLELDGVIIPNSESFTPGPGIMPLDAEKAGIFFTGDNMSILRLVYGSNAGESVDSEALLNINAI